VQQRIGYSIDKDSHKKAQLEAMDEMEGW
jgi:hypothetical protein